MTPSRDQLSLFLDGAEAASIEAWRLTLDPVQASLIPAHVTLCRDDELDGLSPQLLADRLLHARALVLTFGPAERFGEHGLLLPCQAGQAALDALRRRVLGRSDARPQPAHITLAHPRNPRAPGNIDPIPLSLAPLTVQLTDLRWIRQMAGQPWQTLRRFSLDAAPR